MEFMYGVICGVVSTILAAYKFKVFTKRMRLVPQGVSDIRD